MKVYSVSRVLLFLYTVCLAATSTVSRSDYGEVKLFLNPASYDVDSTVLLNDITRKDKEVSYKLKAQLNVDHVWQNGESEFLLKFELVSPQLNSRGKHVNADYMPQKSIWNSYPLTTFYAHWKNGVVENTYLNANEPVEVLNLKRSLVSLFQFQLVDVEKNETDISGSCAVEYETLSMHVIRKIKRGCSGWGLTGDLVQSRHLWRYTLSKNLDELDELHAEEVHELVPELGAAGLKARSWLRLHRLSSLPRSSSTQAKELDDALALIPKDLTPTTLTAPKPDLKEFGPVTDAEIALAIEKSGDALGGAEAGEGGKVSIAAALMDLLPVLRRARTAQLAALLGRETDPERLAGLGRVLGLTGSAAALSAAVAVLRLKDEDVPLPLAQQYFDGFALAPHPEESAVEALSKLSGPARGEARKAAASAAGRLPPAAPAVVALKDLIIKDLARCQDDECKCAQLYALGNLKRPDAFAVLLQNAERGSRPVALAALDALDTLPENELQNEKRLYRLSLIARGPSSLEVRAAALDILLRRSAPDPLLLLELLPLLWELRDAPPELRRVLWQRLHSLAPDYPKLKRLLRVLPPEIGGWDARAAAGTSSVLLREAGAAEGWKTALQSVQLASGGMLRRGRVLLTATALADNSTYDLLAVDLWTRGLESFAGSSDSEEPSEDETMEGGLALSVAGSRLREITLFNGQAELLSHVWAGTASEPTPVLRTLQPLPSVVSHIPLLGGSVLRVERRAALFMALDGQAQVSLWSRTARSLLTLRGAFVAESNARITGIAEFNANAKLELEPRLHIAADLDFYDKVALCVRAYTETHNRERSVRLRSSVGATRVKRNRNARYVSEGRTLSLGFINDAACRELGGKH